MAVMLLFPMLSHSLRSPLAEKWPGSPQEVLSFFPFCSLTTVLLGMIPQPLPSHSHPSAFSLACYYPVGFPLQHGFTNFTSCPLHGFTHFTLCPLHGFTHFTLCPQNGSTHFTLCPLRGFTHFTLCPLQMAKRLLGPRWDQSLRKHYNLDLTGKTLMSVADWKIRAAGQ
eukprot:1153000-Pelagomonas_calceolata.AAC.2